MNIPHKAKSICKASSMAFPLRREQQQLNECLCQKESRPQENGPGCIRRGHQVSSPTGRPSEDARSHSVANRGGQALRQINAKTAPARGTPRPSNLLGRFLPGTGASSFPGSKESSRPAGPDFQRRLGTRLSRALNLPSDVNAGGPR